MLSKIRHSLPVRTVDAAYNHICFNNLHMWHGKCLLLVSLLLKVETIMPRKQAGFTLIEIAIVLVIIGLLLGGVLKGQELINNAKVKNFAQDFRTLQILIYGYQDKYRAIPGDDASVVTHLGAAGTQATTPASSQGNGRIDGDWDTSTATDESLLFWQHVRLAGLATGTTTVATSGDYVPKNADGGRIGVESGSRSDPMIASLKGTHMMCSTGLLGRYIKALDVLLDDGLTDSGSVRSISGTARGTGAVATSAVVDGDTYTVCMAL